MVLLHVQAGSVVAKDAGSIAAFILVYVRPVTHKLALKPPNSMAGVQVGKCLDDIDIIGCGRTILSQKIVILPTFPVNEIAGGRDDGWCLWLFLIGLFWYNIIFRWTNSDGRSDYECR